MTITELSHRLAGRVRAISATSLGRRDRNFCDRLRAVAATIEGHLAVADTRRGRDRARALNLAGDSVFEMDDMLVAAIRNGHDYAGALSADRALCSAMTRAVTESISAVRREVAAAS